MNYPIDRVRRYAGTPREMGLAAGRDLGARLEQTYKHYVASLAGDTDLVKLRAGALPWLRGLPERFQEEFEGLAEGAGLPLQDLVEWCYIEECEKKECSGAVALFDGRAWVARNNDTYVPELWGYATVRETTGRIPTLAFTMEGDVFTPTGVNRERLWLHYNFLSVWDAPRPGRPHMPCYVFLTEALELCRTIADVEARLNEIDRDGGMLLFAVDGKTQEAALFDCLCAQHYRRDLADGWIVGTNHYCTCEDRTLGDDEGSISTLRRFKRMEGLIGPLAAGPAPRDIPAALRGILADDIIERRDKKLVTAYSNVACPATGELWYTFGGYPAASRGDWQQLPWPWPGAGLPGGPQ
jgi:hypothetical protein